MKSLMIAALTAAAMFSTGIAVADCGSCDSHAAKTENIRKLTTAELADIVAKRPGSIMLVNAIGNMPGVKMIPGSISLPTDSEEKVILAALKDKNAHIVTYCANVHCTASPKLAKRLIKLGYKNVSEYPEGIAGWAKAGMKFQQ